MLIVEDESIVAYDIQQALAACGYSPLDIAASAEEAIAHASGRCPDVVLMDIRIKGSLDGLATAKLLQQRFDVPIVYLTAHADVGSIERARETNPQAYLLKPVKEAELIAAIELALHNHEMARCLRERKHEVETELAITYERLRLAVEAGRSVGWDWDVRSGLDRWFGDLQTLFGISAENYTDQIEDFRRRVHAEDQELVWKAIADAQRSREPYVAEFRLLRDDGTVRWVTARGKFYYTSDGDPERMLGMAVDITDRKETEQKLRESQDQLAGIIRSASDGIIAIDTEQRIVQFNVAAEKIFGCTADEATGATIDRFIPQRFRVEHNAHVRRFAESGVASREMRGLCAVHSDGHEFPIEASISQHEVNEKKLFTVIIRDMTERRRAEEAIRESDERFRLVANTAPVMIWMSGCDKLCNYFNQPWLKFTGRSMEQEIGQGWSSGVHPNDLSTCLKIYSEAFDARTEFKMEYRLRRFDGEFRWIVDSGTPRYEPDGSFQGYIGSCIDITESKCNQEELQKSLRFEMLLTELSARFVSVTAANIDSEIVNAQRQIVEALDLDRSTLAQLQDDQNFVVTHCWALPGLEPFPGFAVKDLPWMANVILRGEQVCYARIADLPEEAARDKEVALRFGPQSSAIFPFKVGGKVIGGMAFGSVRREREWPDTIVNRLRLVVEMIGNGLARTRAEKATLDAFDEVQRLRDRLRRENTYLQQEVRAARGHVGLIGESAALKLVLAQVEQVAATNSTVLLVGETGTGKELLASAIHERSLRGSKPMVKVSCAAIPETLIESELFGREKGAYTSALTRQVGRFELAHGSTLFLDEVGELPLEMQVKLLRVLEERLVERLGSSKPIQVDVRIIAATNRDLEKAVREKAFRADLFYRLNVFPIRTPALRERPEDIPLLVRSFVDEFAKSFGKGIEEVDKNCIPALQRYPWPGNIRELRNTVERAMILASGPLLQINPPSDYSDLGGTGLSYVDAERKHVRNVLEMTGWRIRGRGGAAEILGLKPTTLDSRIAKLGLARQRDDKIG